MNTQTIKQTIKINKQETYVVVRQQQRGQRGLPYQEVGEVHHHAWVLPRHQGVGVQAVGVPLFLHHYHLHQRPAAVAAVADHHGAVQPLKHHHPWEVGVGGLPFWQRGHPLLRPRGEVAADHHDVPTTISYYSPQYN